MQSASELHLEGFRTSVLGSPTLLRDPRGPSLLYRSPTRSSWNLSLWPERDTKIWPGSLGLLQAGTRRKKKPGTAAEVPERPQLSAFLIIRLINSPFYGVLWQPGSSPLRASYAFVYLSTYLF